MNINQEQLFSEFNDSVKFDYDLKKKIGLILVARLKFILKLVI